MNRKLFLISVLVLLFVAALGLASVAMADEGVPLYQTPSDVYPVLDTTVAHFGEAVRLTEVVETNLSSDRENGFVRIMDDAILETIWSQELTAGPNAWIPLEYSDEVVTASELRLSQIEAIRLDIKRDVDALRERKFGDLTVKELETLNETGRYIISISNSTLKKWENALDTTFEVPPWTILSPPASLNETVERASTGSGSTTTSVPKASKKFKLGWDKEWYWSPFRATTKVIDRLPKTHETLAEPGVLLDNTAAFDYLSAAETPVNVPEGAFAYVAVGSMDIVHDGYKLVLPARKDNGYLVLFRGYPDDATDFDLNQQVWLSEYPRGFGIYSPMPAGAYVSLDWFRQQVDNMAESQGDPNCGGDGCDLITTVLVDLWTHTFRAWTGGPDPESWKRTPWLQ